MSPWVFSLHSGDEVELPLAPRRTSALPVPGRSGSFDDALDITHQPHATSLCIRSNELTLNSAPLCSGDEVESPLAPRRTSTLPVPGRSASFDDALDIMRPRAASFDVLQQPRHAGLSAMPSHLLTGTQPYHAAASTLAGHLPPLQPAGPPQIRQARVND